MVHPKAMLQCVVVCCSFLCCNDTLYGFPHYMAACNVLQWIEICCSVLQHVTVCCRVLPCIKGRYSVYSVLQCVTICCSVLLCHLLRNNTSQVYIALCCSVAIASCRIRLSFARMEEGNVQISDQSTRDLPFAEVNLQANAAGASQDEHATQ